MIYFDLLRVLFLLQELGVIYLLQICTFCFIFFFFRKYWNMFWYLKWEMLVGEFWLQPIRSIISKHVLSLRSTHLYIHSSSRLLGNSEMLLGEFGSCPGVTFYVLKFVISEDYRSYPFSSENTYILLKVIFSSSFENRYVPGRGTFDIFTNLFW